ncbi:MAG: YidC/Oxa1 family membrane protein insertase [Actinomycetia bacterium]|nr:YidC/Oxa1 family membrane protein insertase [Actinomycetes bacterium]
MTKQVKSTVGMQKLQPLMKEIQEKYADDKQKQSEELMKLYKEQEVSPFSGCLPMLLQMPLLFAFYGMLSIAHMNKAGKLVGGGPLYRFLEGAAAPFLKFIHLPGATMQAAGGKLLRAAPGFLPDIMTTPDMVLKAHGGWDNIMGAIPSLWPYVLILLLFAAGSLIPMLMMPGGGNQQKSMGVLMSGVMLYIGFIIPAGALLYYVVSTFFAVGQQALIQKQMKLAEEQKVAEIIVAEDQSPKKSKKGASKQAQLPGADTDTKLSAGTGKTSNKSKNTNKAKGNKGTGATSGSKK